MATVRKRNNSYVVIYDYLNEGNERKQKWESFASKAEATKRAKEIELDKVQNTFITPSNQTIAEFLDEWIQMQAKAKWQFKTYQFSKSLIDLHIIPLIGNIEIQKLTPYHVEMLYDKLRSKKVMNSKSYNKSEDEIPCLSPTTIFHVHSI